MSRAMRGSWRRAGAAYAAHARRTPPARAALFAIFVIAASGCASLGGAPGRPALDRSAIRDLRTAIDSMVAAPEFQNAHWGILIVAPRTGDTLYAHNAGKLFMPASNQKLLTGATALAQLGPEYRFRTTFAARGSIVDSVLGGDLVVIGTGDPTVSDRMRGDAMIPLREVADSLLTRGVRRIAGRVTRAGDAFPDAIYGYGWGWDDFDYAYSAGVDELLFNEGFARLLVRAGSRAGDTATVRTAPSRLHPTVRTEAVTIDSPTVATASGASAPDTATQRRRAASVLARFDSVTGGVVVTGTILVGDSAGINIAHRDPAGAYLAALREALAERGIVVADSLSTASVAASTPLRRSAVARPDSSGDGDGGAREPLDTTETLDTLFTVLSPPLREVLPALQKPSQNQIAEVLFKTLGRERTGVGTADSGRAVVERQLAAWGADSGGFAVRDGSGLSRHDYLTPRTIVLVLDAMRRDTAFAVFYDALPIAGVDGTISRRMRGTPAEGNVHAKTGSVDKARSLSGYVTTADGEMLLFSLLANNWTVPVRNVERVQDAIGARLAALRLYRAR